ncbi:MAG TPA: alpha/beta hydrolase, partial [Pseudonocardia sp.]|nr:alpha/beta hydrolase [Pseudonocardia sp.]
MDGAESVFFDVDGIRTHVLSAGCGQPLLLLHGGAHGECAEASWGPVLASLAAHHRVLAPDLLGFGDTDKVRDFADGLGRIRGHLGRLVELLGPWPGGLDVVALSMGGAVLLRDLTSDAPLLPTRRAVLVSAGGPPIGGPARAALAEYDGTVEGMRRQVGLTVSRPAEDPELEPVVAVRHEKAALPGAFELVASLGLRPPGAPAAGPPPDDTPYDRVRVPVLVVAGGGDRLKPPGFAEAVAARIPGATLRLFPAAGHCPQLDDPKGFAEAVLDFLREP